jgi:aldehyde:ferredoxin oxidoreductase
MAQDLVPELLKEPQKLVYFKAFLSGSLQVESNQANHGPKKTQDEPNDGCHTCPVACARPQKNGWRRHQEELALLWGLDPQEEGLPELAGDFRRLANDLGLEAFELSGSVALLLKTPSFPPNQGSIRQIFQELRQETSLGQLLGQGRAMVAKSQGLDLQIDLQIDRQNASHLGQALQKQSPHDAPTTALLDSLGICERAAGSLSGSPKALGALGEVLTAKYGRVFAPTELAALGHRIVSLETDYNQKAAVSI